MLETAATECGDLRVFDSPPLLLLHMFQQHWIPELYSMLASLHTREVLDNARAHLNKLRHTVNKTVTHYHQPCSKFLLPDEYLLSTDTPWWSKNVVREMAQRNFINTFIRWQRIGSCTQRNEPECGNRNMIYYGEHLAEVGCTQVAIKSLEQLKEEEGSENGGNGQFNYKDNYKEYGYNFCFTKNREYNYACKSSPKEQFSQEMLCNV